MPDDYPSHRQVLAYFERYAEHFGVRERYLFNTEVVRVVEAPDDHAGALDAPRWDVTIRRADDSEITLRYDSVVVANGHNWSPKISAYPGLVDFTGEVLHSADYKSADQLRGKRVLVVGAGNTGCDIAVASAQKRHRHLPFHPTQLLVQPEVHLRPTVRPSRRPTPRPQAPAAGTPGDVQRHAVAPFPAGGLRASLARGASRKPAAAARAVLGASLRLAAADLFADLDPAVADGCVSRIGRESPWAQYAMMAPRAMEPITVPLLVVGAADDALLARSDLERAATELDALVRIVPGGHDVMLDGHWRAGLEVILDWVDTSCPPGSPPPPGADALPPLTHVLGPDARP